MKQSRIGRVVLAATGVLAVGLAGPAIGPAQGSDAPSYKEFKASTFRDVDSQYIVNGDEPAATDGALRQFYDRMMGPKKTAKDGLIVNRVNGQDDKWSASQALNLTYCVSTKFGSNYAAVVNAMNSGSWTPGNILGHELGHSLGFRHEHTRPEAGTCFEDNNWVPLTAYDNVSIMHYPQCNGGSPNLTFSNLDRQGAALAYP